STIGLTPLNNLIVHRVIFELSRARDIPCTVAWRCWREFCHCFFQLGNSARHFLHSHRIPLWSSLYATPCPKAPRVQRRIRVTATKASAFLVFFRRLRCLFVFSLARGAESIIILHRHATTDKNRD